MLNRQEEMPGDEFHSINKIWFEGSQLEGVKSFLKTVNKNVLDLKSVVSKVFDYRRKLIGSNLRLCLLGTLKRVSSTL